MIYKDGKLMAMHQRCFENGCSNLDYVRWMHEEPSGEYQTSVTANSRSNYVIQRMGQVDSTGVDIGNWDPSPLSDEDWQALYGQMSPGDSYLSNNLDCIIDGAYQSGLSCSVAFFKVNRQLRESGRGSIYSGYITYEDIEFGSGTYKDPKTGEEHIVIGTATVGTWHPGIIGGSRARSFQSLIQISIHVPARESPVPPINCKKVTIEARVLEQPRFVNNEKGDSGKLSGMLGKFVFTVEYFGEPAANVAITESNQVTVTRNGVEQDKRVEPGYATSDENGLYADRFGIYFSTDGSKEMNEKIKTEFASNTWAKTGVQTQTLKFPNGDVCNFTSTRTLTNARPKGPSLSYTMTTTQPVLVP